MSPTHADPEQWPEPRGRLDPDDYPEHTVRSLAPLPKVIATGLAGAATIVAVYVAGLFGLAVPPTVAAALTTILAFLAGYLKSNGDR